MRTDGHGRAIDQTLRNRQSRASAIETYRLWSYYRPDGALVALVRAQTNETQLRTLTPADSTGQSARVGRYFMYDSAGRRLGATDPDSDSRSAGRTQANRTWRYHFNRIGDLIAVRDPRGCGQNFFYDRGGRLVGEDYVLYDKAQRPSKISTTYVDGSTSNGVIGSERLFTPEPVDVRYDFDTYPTWATTMMGSLPIGEPAAPSGYTGYAKGQATAVSDRGQRSTVAYDARGNAIWSARQMAIIGDAGPVPQTSLDEVPVVGGSDFAAQGPFAYDGRAYVRTAVFDFANRPQSMTLPINPDAPAAPKIGGTLTYSTRGLPVTAGVTFGGTAYTRVIVAATTYNADGLVTNVTYGDGGGAPSRAATQSTTTYDVRNRPTRMRTTRAPLTGGTPGALSGVTLAADQTLVWDAASNLTHIEDNRIAAEWAAGSRPQTITVDHDALYRVTNAHFDYTGGTGTDDDAIDWRTAMDETHAADPMRTQPAPPVAPMPTDRVRDLTWSYDWLGNMTEWNDDVGQFYERSIGDIRNGYGDGDHRPSALYFSADFSGTSTTNRGGYVELTYGEGGNALSMTVHGECGNRGGTTCDAPETPYGDPSGGSSSSARAAAAHATCQCKTEQHYQYRWDELNRIAEARRYDRDGTLATPTWKIAVRQRYRYDSANVRTVKQTLETLVDEDTDGFGDGDGDPQERLALYVYPGEFERRGLTRDTSGTSYIAAVAKVGATTPSIAETQYVVVGARVVWEATVQPTQLDGIVTRTARVTMGIGDLIGTMGAVLDLESGELVEASTYYPNGARESYVRNGGDDDAIAPEPAGFTGKEGDEEVGLTYFGERYLISRIGRWASPDPLQIHAGGGGEIANSYHYVAGNHLQARDPDGLDVSWTRHDFNGANGARTEVYTATLRIAVVVAEGMDPQEALQQVREQVAFWTRQQFVAREGSTTRVLTIQAEVSLFTESTFAPGTGPATDALNGAGAALDAAVEWGHAHGTNVVLYRGSSLNPDEPHTSSVKNGVVMTYTPANAENDRSPGGYHVAAHEIGHFLGLGDLYEIDGVRPDGTRRTIVPEDLKEQIMANGGHTSQTARVRGENMENLLAAGIEVTAFGSHGLLVQTPGEKSVSEEWYQRDPGGPLAQHRGPNAPALPVTPPTVPQTDTERAIVEE